MSIHQEAPETAPIADAHRRAAGAPRPSSATKRLLATVLLLVTLLAVAGCEAAEESEPSGSDNKSQDSKREKRDKKDKPEMTSGQKNALEAGQNYIDFAGFSKKGLIQQLSSSAGDGYSKADATFAANHVDVDWNEEAVEAAKNYLDTSSFSKQALIQQLTSSAGDKFTEAQARYAVEKVY
ncbi:MAG TPA: Ltp family lipoprotein [Solirubrobacteraceae bacterium]